MRAEGCRTLRAEGWLECGDAAPPAETLRALQEAGFVDSVHADERPIMMGVRLSSLARFLKLYLPFLPRRALRV